MIRLIGCILLFLGIACTIHDVLHAGDWPSLLLAVCLTVAIAFITPSEDAITQRLAKMLKEEKK